MEQIKNAYEDENKKLDDEFSTQLLVAFKLREILDDYGYYLSAELEDGKPVISLLKDTGGRTN